MSWSGSPGSSSSNSRLSSSRIGPQLNEVGHQPAQARVRRQPPLCERHRHTRPLARDSELAAELGRRGRVEHVRVDIGLVARGREEPRFDRSLATHALDPTATLREPDVTQTPAEKPTLTFALWNDAERAE